MKPVFLIAIVAVAMIGMMIPSVFAEIEVTVTPYKESHYIDELNWVTVEVSKVVPNTNLCTQFTQNKIVLSEVFSYIENPDIMLNSLSKSLESGNYQVRVFYGECDVENSFGNGYATIMFKKELSSISRFMENNYFPERIDVGIDYQKDELFTYPYSFTSGCISMGHSYKDDRWICGISNAVSQTWNMVNGGADDVEIIIAHGEITIPTDSKHLLQWGDVYGEFRCYGYEHRYCFSNNSFVELSADGGRMFHSDKERKAEQIDIWVPIILDKIKSNPMPSESKLSSMYSTQSQSDITFKSDSFIVKSTSNSEDSISIENNECGEGTVLKNNVCVIEISCGKGTIEQNGQCVVDEKEGGGCLIATATYGSELAPQVQQLRELRDNQLLQTESGTAFMSTFNDIYYSFSPTIADMEREHPMFKEAVKLAITPMISSLSLMENAETESEVLSIGISVIMLNLGMYLGVPAIVIVGIRKKF
jgi:hypothetical protein